MHATTGAGLFPERLDIMTLTNTQITELCVLAEGMRTPRGPHEVVAAASGVVLHYRTGREAFVARRILARNPKNGAVMVRPTEL